MDRDQLKVAYKHLYDEVEEILFRHDPVGINFGENADEYDPEVDIILPRLKDAQSETDVLEIVHEAFVQMFGAGDARQKNITPYKGASKEIWAAWLKFSKDQAK